MPAASGTFTRRDGQIGQLQATEGFGGKSKMDAWYMFLIILFSAAGMAYFMYGKKQAAFVPLLCGLALMIYPYFVSHTLPLVAIGGVLVAIPYFVRL